MNATTRADAFAKNWICCLTRALMVAGFLFCVSSSHAQMPPPSPYHTLDLWEFNDAGWLTDSNSSPVGYTNLLNPHGSPTPSLTAT